MFCCCFFFSFFHREISELRHPIAAKLCHVTGSYFSLWSENFGDPPQTNFGGQKRAKFGAISNNLKLRSPISPERIKLTRIGNLCIENDSYRVRQKNPVNFGPLTTKFWMCILTHVNQLFRSTIFRPLGGAAPPILHVLQNGQSLLTHTPSGMEGPPTICHKLSSQSDLRRRAASRWALFQISRFFSVTGIFVV